MVKIGQKRVDHQTSMNIISPKQAAKLRTYNAVRDRLMGLCGGKSELSGKQGNINSIELALSCHHITGRSGSRLSNPFNMIILLEREHWIAQDTMSWDHKLELLKFIKPIRIAQGYKPEDYEPLEWHYNLLRKIN